MQKKSWSKRAKGLIYFGVAEYFGFWAKKRLRKWKPQVVVVTGSSGKTTTFEMLKAQFEEEAIFADGANSVFGVPFQILGLQRKTYATREWPGLFWRALWNWRAELPKKNVYIVECDCDRPGEGKFLADLLEPDIVLWLNVSGTHAMNFDFLVKKGKFSRVEEAIASEYGWLAEKAKKLVLVNGDDERILSELDRVGEEVEIKENRMDDWLEEYALSKRGTKFKLKGRDYELKEALVPQATWLAVAFCEELAEFWQVEMDRNFGKLVLPPGRSNILKGIKETTLIDSSYNTSPEAMREMLELMARIKVEEKWLVIGDMLELGEQEAEAHRELGREIAKNKAKWQRVVLIGRRVEKYTAPELQKQGVKAEAFMKTKEAWQYLEREIRGGETILFKGSQFLEAIVEKMLANPEDEKKLVRREKMWQKRRKRFTGIK